MKSVAGDYDEMVADADGVSLDLANDGERDDMADLSHTQVRDNSQMDLIGHQETYQSIIEDANELFNDKQVTDLAPEHDVM